MGRPRNRGGGVPPPLRPKDVSELRRRRQQEQRHREDDEDAEGGATTATATAATTRTNGHHDNGLRQRPPHDLAHDNSDDDDEADPRRGPKKRMLRSRRRSRAFRLGVLWALATAAAAVAGYYYSGGATTILQDWLLPWGFPVATVPSSPELRYAPLNVTSDALRYRHGRTRRIVERRPPPRSSAAGGVEPHFHLLLKAPETVLFDAKGTMLVMTEEARLLRLDELQDAEDEANGTIVTMVTATYLRDLGPGRPLGGAFGHGRRFRNTLYVADALLGLTRIRNYHDPTSMVEIVASSILAESAAASEEEDDRHRQERRRRFTYVDDVVVGPRSNKVYFTDATIVTPDRIFRHHHHHGEVETRRFGFTTWTWDTLHASKVDLMLGHAEGRVYEYDPFTDRTRELGRGLHFANGISIDPTERFLVVAETFGPAIHKYWLRGDKAGQWEVLVDSSQLPGYPDGIDCEPTGNTCYAVLPSSIVPIHKLLSILPSWLDRLLRTLLLTVPRHLAPPTQPYAGVVIINTDTGSVELLQDPTGRDVSLLCGVTHHEGKLYLGSVHNDYVAVYDLQDTSSP